MNRKIRVLFVDDEQPILHTLKRLFLDSGFHILTAESGEEGLEKLEKDPPVHIVVSDYRMPGMNGVEFLKIVSMQWPETIRIVLSGYADTANVVAAINDGQIFKFIPKPWNDEDFKNIVMEAAEKYHLQEHNMVTLSAWKLIETLPLIMLRVDIDGNIVWMNIRAGEVLGEETHRRNIAEVLPEVSSVVSNARQTGEATELVLVRGRSYQADAAMLVKDGNREGCVLVLDDRE
jgi:response regulator RpfG family c-di-GMP phosphodiesterase